MKDENDYCEIYSCGPLHLYYLKSEGRVSFLERKINLKEGVKYWMYTEVIVPSEQLLEAIEIPSSYETGESSKMQLLFGNLEGMKHFTDFCDENGVETKTFIWEEEWK